MKQSRSGFLQRFEGLTPLRGRWLRYAFCVFWLLVGAALSLFNMEVSHFHGSWGPEGTTGTVSAITCFFAFYICARVLIHLLWNEVQWEE